MMIKGSNLDGQIGFIDFSLVNAVTDAHEDDNQLKTENKRLLGIVVNWAKALSLTWQQVFDRLSKIKSHFSRSEIVNLKRG